MSIKLDASDKINKFVKNINTQHKFLKNYQALILRYFMSKEFDNKDMLLLWLAVGRGKTLLSLACAIAGINTNKFDKIIILSPKAIQDEFYKNLFLYFYLDNNNDKNKANKEYNKYIKYFYFIPYNAWNSYQQFMEIKSFEHSLFIIDEAHLFMKSIIKTNILASEYFKHFVKHKYINNNDTNTYDNNNNINTYDNNKYANNGCINGVANILYSKSKEKNKNNNNIGNAKRIYDVIKDIKDKKILCLTGTPSAKTPYETIPIFNLAYKKDLFTIDYNEFNDKYIDTVNETIKNKEELLKKLDGLIAYVPPLTNKDKDQVKATPLIIEEIEMSYNQYKQYLIDWYKEKNEQGFTNKRNMYGLLFGAKSSFHAKTFEDCIYWNDELTNVDKEDRLRYKKLNIDEEHCPKIIKMYNDTINIKGCCCFYFRFTSIYGSKLMEELLKSKGYTTPDKENIFAHKAKRYVIFNGNITNDKRNHWKNLFNDKRNKHGEYIKYIILSPSGLVGITLKNVRYLGIGSVEFNYSNIRQVLGRCNRLNSHIDLDKKDRTLINKMYIMLKNNKYYKQHKEEVEEISNRTTSNYDKPCPTIERIIFNDSLKDDIINEEFKNKILIKASITEILLNDF